MQNWFTDDKNENVQIVKDTNSRVDEFVQSFNSHIYMNTSKPIGDKNKPIGDNKYK